MATEILPQTEVETSLQPPPVPNGSPPCEIPTISDHLSSLSPIFQLPPLTFPAGMEPPTHLKTDQAENSTHVEQPVTTTNDARSENFLPGRSEFPLTEGIGVVDENTQDGGEKTPARKRRNSVKSTGTQNKNTENQEEVPKKRRGRPPKRPPPITMTDKVSERGDPTMEISSGNVGDGGNGEAAQGDSMREERRQGIVNAAQVSDGHGMQPARVETEKPHTDNLASLWEACQIVDNASRQPPPASPAPSHPPTAPAAGNTYSITLPGGAQAILQLLLPSYVEDAPQSTNPTSSGLNLIQNPPSEHHFLSNDPHLYMTASHYPTYANTPPATPVKDSHVQPPYQTARNSGYGNADDYHYFNFLNTENEMFTSAPPAHQPSHSNPGRNSGNVHPHLNLPTCTPSFSSIVPMSPPPTAPLPNPPNFQAVHSFDLMDLAELCTRQGGARDHNTRRNFSGGSQGWEVVELSHDSQSCMSSTESVMGGSYYIEEHFPEELRELMESGACNFPLATIEPHPIMRPLSPSPPRPTSHTSASTDFRRPAPYIDPKSRQVAQNPPNSQNSQTHASRPITRSMRHRTPPPTVSPLRTRSSPSDQSRPPTTTATKSVPVASKNGKIPLARMPRRKNSQPYPSKKGSDDESEEDIYAKKQSHREAVRRTREEIKQGLGDLKAQILEYKVPKRSLGLSADRRQSNLTVVQQAIQYIKALKSDLEVMEEDVHKFSADNRKLESLRMRKEGGGKRLGHFREPITVRC